MTPRCPICWDRVHPTRNHNIAGHFDQSRRPCPASGEPMTIAIIDPKATA